MNVAALNIDRCVCQNVPFATLLPQARAHGWDLDALSAATGCGARCGLCRPYLREMLARGVTTFDAVLIDALPGPGRA
ncbi:MAG TPA: hypothetical protein VHW65_07230 [Gemmatimonadales bacterium]|nr:hypothetical protein [Gemmatimonadales bacterium]